jgi:cell division protein FtsL
MIINSENLNTVANVTNLGLVTAILNYNEKNYEINKEILSINQKILKNNKDDNIYEMLNHIINLLESINNKINTKD